MVRFSAGVVRPALFAALTSALLAVGCRPPSGPSRHEMIAGTVESVRPGTGELTVRTSGFGSEREQGQQEKVSCLLTSDAEVYINDRFSPPEAIAVGDLVELIGYRESTPRAERFVVCLAQITRREPLPPEPDLSPMAATAASRPQPGEN